MRKTISTILVLVMVLSVFTSFGVGAEHWAQPAIDFVTENGYWIAPEPINPDKVATRAETASLFARILISKIPEYNGAYVDVTADNIYAGDITASSLMGVMVGNNGYFRPYDTLTREELASILDRASRMVSDEFDDTEYNMDYYKDGEEVSEWANQSVQNTSKYALMKGKGAKLFDPKGTVTIGEVATVIKSLTEISDVEKTKTAATARDLSSADNIENDYNVIQSGGIADGLGVAGYGMMVRFDKAPGDIYVARKAIGSSSGEAFAPACPVVKVIDPNGNTLIRENMYYKSGLMEKIISIPNGEPGIYRIVFTGGDEGDICTIGVKDPVSWGVWGEDSFLYTDSTPKKGYIYIPKKNSILSIGIGGLGVKATLWNETGTTRVGETPESKNGTAEAYRTRVNISGLQGDTVYMLQVPEGFNGILGFLGAPKIICPTPEMARDLKGGIVYYEDKYTANMEGGFLQLSGPLQVRARERMVEIYDELGGDFTVNFTKPAWNDNLDNPQAEAQLHSHYHHSVSNLSTTMEKQVLDPSNPYFGQFAPLAMMEGKTAWPAQNWQHYVMRTGPVLGTKNFVGALTINAETNAFYANSVLQKRAELEYLAWAVQMNETMMKYCYSANNYGASKYFHGTETFELGDHSALAHGYGEVRYFLSPKTRAICDEAIWAYCEVGMTAFGQGVNNQAMMGMVAAIDAYKATGWEHFKDSFETRALGAVYPSVVPVIGQTSPLGFWQEAGGTDGSNYGRMSEGMWDVCVLEYFTLDKDMQDPNVVAKMKEATERFLKFDALFYAPTINGFGGKAVSGDYNTNAFTSRQPQAYGGHSAMPGNTYLRYYFPQAARNEYSATLGYNDPETYINQTSTTAGYIMANDANAYWNIGAFWDTYEKNHSSSKEDYMAGSSWRMYRAFHVPRTYGYGELPYLPYELPGDYNVYDPDGGAIAIKHKGLYVMTYYDNNIQYQSGISWLSSGPAQIWDEYFSTIVASHKENYVESDAGNYARDNAKNDVRGKYVESEISLTGIVGTDAAGILFAEGKEIDKEFNWIEEGKSYEITGINPFNGAKIIWRYYMTDEGIEFEAGLDEVSVGSNLYVQIPVIDITKDVVDSTLTMQDNSLVFAHNDKKTIISWDESVDAEFVAKLGEESHYRHLKLYITSEKPMVRFKITREMGDYVFEPLFAKYKNQ